jgi:hypothetical protein
MTPANADSTLELGIQSSAMHLSSSFLTTQSRSFEEIEDLCADRPLATGLIWISTLHCSGRRFSFRKPISVQETYEHGIWTHRFDPLGILAYGDTREEAMEAFCAEFACCWDQIACECDDNLTADAQDLKRKLLDLVQDGAELPE